MLSNYFMQKNKSKIIVAFTMLSIAMIIIGVVFEEPRLIYNKASKICLECCGIG